MFSKAVYGVQVLLASVVLLLSGSLFSSCEKDRDNGLAADTQFAQAMLKEHNYARTKPKEYAENFIKPNFGKTNGYAESCYETMTAMQPLPPLALDDRFCRAAQWFANDLAKSGRVAHEGSDGSNFVVRLEREGATNARSESCSWGVESPRAILVQLLIDKNVKTLGHRKNALDPVAKVMGAGQAKGGKAAYGVATVIDYGY